MNGPPPPPPSLEMIENQRMMQVMILARNFHGIQGPENGLNRWMLSFPVILLCRLSNTTNQPTHTRAHTHTQTNQHVRIHILTRGDLIHPHASNTNER
jgi:hypothetical protein